MTEPKELTIAAAVRAVVEQRIAAAGVVTACDQILADVRAALEGVPAAADPTRCNATNEAVREAAARMKTKHVGSLTRLAAPHGVCKCTCGQPLPRQTGKGRRRLYVDGHNPHKRLKAGRIAREVATKRHANDEHEVVFSGRGFVDGRGLSSAMGSSSLAGVSGVSGRAVKPNSEIRRA